MWKIVWNSAKNTLQSEPPDFPLFAMVILGKFSWAPLSFRFLIYAVGVIIILAYLDEWDAWPRSMTVNPDDDDSDDDNDMV